MLIPMDPRGWHALTHFMDYCASLSRCKRHPVVALGCEIIEDVLNVRNVSVNGKASLRECSGELGKCGCLHAEELLALEGSFDLVILSMSPCPKCYTMFLDPGKVREVWYFETSRHGTKFMRESIFPIIKVSKEDYDTIAKRWASLRRA